MIDDYAAKRSGYYRNERGDILRLVPPRTHALLDFGCGEGVFARAAKERYSIEFVAGVDLHADAARRSREVLDDVVEVDIEKSDLPYCDGRFDCIVCADVLEHLRDPWTALARLRRVLGSEGVLIASVPNLGNLRVVKLIVRDRFDYTRSGVLDRTHLRFFTLHTLRSMFEQAGYEIVRVERKYRRGFFSRHARVWSLGYVREGGVSSFTVVARMVQNA